MKKTGTVFIILGALALLGAIISKNNCLGPLFWIALGILLRHRAVVKNEKVEELEEWWYNTNSDE